MGVNVISNSPGLRGPMACFDSNEYVVTVIRFLRSIRYSLLVRPLEPLFLVDVFSLLYKMLFSPQMV